MVYGQTDRCRGVGIQSIRCGDPPSPFLLQEEGVSGVKRLMEFEPYDLDEVKSRLGEVLDEFIENLE